MVEEGIRGEISNTIYWQEKAINQYIKDCDKNR